MTQNGENGAATPLTLILGVAFIVLPVMVLVLTVPAWEQRAVDAQDAARAASRVLAIADNWQEGEGSADQAVDELMYSDGLPASQVQVSYSGSLVPGGIVTATVTVAVPAGEVPGLGWIGELHYTANSTQHVDSYEDSPS